MVSEHAALLNRLTGWVMGHHVWYPGKKITILLEAHSIRWIRNMHLHSWGSEHRFIYKVYSPLHFPQNGPCKSLREFYFLCIVNKAFFEPVGADIAKRVTGGPNVYRFCWNWFLGMHDRRIKGHNAIKKKTILKHPNIYVCTNQGITYPCANNDGERYYNCWPILAWLAIRKGMQHFRRTI